MGKPQSHYGKFRIRWTDDTGARRSEVYASREEASFQLQRRELEVQEIKRGLRSRIEKKSFADLAEYWMKHRGSQKRSGRDDQSMLSRHLLPAYGKLSLSDISRSSIDCYRNSKAHLNLKTVANHLALLRAMLNLAQELSWLSQPPKIKLPKFKILTHNYRFIHTRDEIDRFLLCAKHHGDMVHALYATAVYTGMRAGELAGLRWADIDLPSRKITIQRSYDGPTKSNEIRHVPVFNVLLPLIQEWRLKNPLPVVFPNSQGRPHGKSARVFQEIFQTVLDEAKFEKGPTSRGTNRALTFHDLRHTFASQWVMNNGEMYKLQRMLGHQSAQMTSRYAHLSPDAFQQDWSRFGDPCRSADVIQLNKQG